MAVSRRYCKDCVKEFGIPVPNSKDVWFPPAHHRPRPVVKDSGGRCATHWRVELKRRKAAAHERRVQNVYGLPEGAYEALYRHQGGVCALCGRAKGIRKRLAVDHDHDTGLVYGLLCGPCNKDVMGVARRDIAYFQRCIEFLRNPPAKQLGIVAYHKENRETDG